MIPYAYKQIFIVALKSTIPKIRGDIMQLYVMKCKTTSKKDVVSEIMRIGGTIQFVSPVLPIISAELSTDQKREIEEKFDFHYFIEDPIGEIQDVTGSLTGAKKPERNPITIIPSLNMQPLRYLSKTGWGNNVAVLDSGINEKWVSEKYDYTNFGNTAVIDHGSKVCNIIRKIAPGANVLSFKITHDGSVGFTNTMIAITEAVAKADIINMSIGFKIDWCSKQTPCGLCETINSYTVNEGKLFVAAAGNEHNENSIQCPGNSQEAITVGAVERDLTSIADYSSKGLAGIKKPNIVATGKIHYSVGSKFAYDQGTSFSAPIITGVVASLFESKEKDTSKVKFLLYSAAKDIGAPEHHQGFGLLDVAKIVEVLEDDQSSSKGEGQESK